MWDAFATEYLPPEPKILLLRATRRERTTARSTVRRQAHRPATSTTTVARAGQRADRRLGRTACAQDLGIEVDVLDYHEHALGGGERRHGRRLRRGPLATRGQRWGVGIDPNITTASMKAVLSALERLGVDLGQHQRLAGAATVEVAGTAD